MTEIPAGESRNGQVSNPDAQQDAAPGETAESAAQHPARIPAEGDPASERRPALPVPPRGPRGPAGPGGSRGPAGLRGPASPGGPGGELLTEFQRWLIRSSAKNLRREIGGQVRKTLGSSRTEPQDVWGAATTEPPPGLGEAPECAWCPVCRAARRLRESGPGVGSQLAGAGDAVALAVADALEAVNTALSRTGQSSGRPSGQSSGQPSGWAAATRPEGPADGPDDRG